MIECTDLGTIHYLGAWQIQEKLQKKREEGKIPNRILLLEHLPIFTLGKRDCEADIISPEQVIAAEGIDVVKSNRGGRVTYHGPGQLVCYFICDIDEMVKASRNAKLVGDSPACNIRKSGGFSGIKKFVWLIEEICIRVLTDFGIEGIRDPQHPGIWVARNKIAAIGLHVTRGISQHGFSLNVNCNLSHYRHIIPCGIHNRGVTSIENILGKAPNISEVKKSVITHIGRIFCVNVNSATDQDLG